MLTYSVQYGLLIQNEIIVSGFNRYANSSKEPTTINKCRFLRTDIVYKAYRSKSKTTLTSRIYLRMIKPDAIVKYLRLMPKTFLGIYLSVIVELIKFNVIINTYTSI